MPAAPAPMTMTSQSMTGLCRPQPRLNRLGRSRRRLLHERCHVLGRQCVRAWLCKETQVALPLDEAVLPGAFTGEVAIGKTIAVAAAGIDVHLHIGDAGIQHCAEIFSCPHGMDLVLPAGAGDE